MLWKEIFKFMISFNKIDLSRGGQINILFSFDVMESFLFWVKCDNVKYFFCFRNQTFWNISLPRVHEKHTSLFGKKYIFITAMQFKRSIWWDYKICFWLEAISMYILLSIGKIIFVVKTREANMYVLNDKPHL